MEVEFSRPLNVDSLGEREKLVRIEATTEECANLAQRFGLPEIADLKAEIAIKPIHKGEEWRVRGKLSAIVTQICVVSLEQFPAEVEEEFETIFSIHAAPEEDIEEIDMDFLDGPEAIINGIIDLGELTSQHLSLAIDPFPKKPGVIFTDLSDENEESPPKVQPFAGLAAMLDKKHKQ